VKRKVPIRVCDKGQLKDGDYMLLDVAYDHEASTVIVFCHNGEYLAYRNLCVHMPRRLDCEKATIFDKTGKNLRCSMHGIVYDPITGASISTICNGEKLTPVRIQEKDDSIWVCDRHVNPLTSIAL